MENGQHDVTTNEIMEFLKEHMVMKSEALTKEDGLTKQEFREEMKKYATKEDLRSEIGKLRNDTTDLLDRKIADVRGDGVLLVRKENEKLNTVVEKLAQKNLFTAQDAKEVQTMEPFPKLTTS